MRTIFLSIVSLALLALTPVCFAASLSLVENSITGGDRYDRCLSMIKTRANEAVTTAEAWHKSGGGAAALHCEALALVALHRYADAGLGLDQAAIVAPKDNTELRAALFDQAGNAWLLAGQVEKAQSALDSALSLSPRNEDFLFDRARVDAARKDWHAAEADLSSLLAIDPDRADAFVLRASARHAEGRKSDADADIARALNVYPNYPDALVERGAIKYEAGDIAGAQADWEAAVHDDPDGDAGASARQHLADLASVAAKAHGK